MPGAATGFISGVQWRCRGDAQCDGAYAAAASRREPGASNRGDANDADDGARGGRAACRLNVHASRAGDDAHATPSIARRCRAANSAAAHGKRHGCAAFTKPVANRSTGCLSVAAPRPNRRARNGIADGDPGAGGAAFARSVAGAHPAAREHRSRCHRADRGRSAAAAGLVRRIWA